MPAGCAVVWGDQPQCRQQILPRSRTPHRRSHGTRSHWRCWNHHSSAGASRRPWPQNAFACVHCDPWSGAPIGGACPSRQLARILGRFSVALFVSFWDLILTLKIFCLLLLYAKIDLFLCDSAFDCDSHSTADERRRLMVVRYLFLGYESSIVASIQTKTDKYAREFRCFVFFFRSPQVCFYHIYFQLFAVQCWTTRAR